MNFRVVAYNAGNSRRATQESNLRPTAPEGTGTCDFQSAYEDLDEIGGGDPDPLIRGDLPRLGVIRPHSSGRAGEGDPDGDDGRPKPGISADEALHLAIQLAVEARDYERAASLLNVLRGDASGIATAGTGVRSCKRKGA
jgi:hypothetical protein